MMRTFTLDETANYLHGHAPAVELHFDRVSTDTRTMQAGALFVALCGENFDGHTFIDAAIARHAVAAVVSRPLAAGIAQIRVDDTLQALGGLGQMNREQFRGPVIGITGSSGKTGTKEMLAAILGGIGPVLATRGNLNNEVGVPLTLLELSAAHRFAVIEMGASRVGDIAYLAGLAQPRVAVVTNAMPAHIAGFGSLENVARTKGELFAGLGDDGIAVLNVDDPQATLWQELIGTRRIVSWSLSDAGATLHAERIDTASPQHTRFVMHGPGWTQDVQLPLLGRHQVGNALAAAAAAYGVGIEPAQIAAGLGVVAALPGRLRPLSGIGGCQLIDDSYNANPGSMAAAVEVLSNCSGRRLLVIGDMAELGANAAQHHRELGALARRRGIDALYAIGPLSAEAVAAFGDSAWHFDSHEDLVGALSRVLGNGITVLIKGSRSAAMDRVVASLQAADAAEIH